MVTFAQMRQAFENMPKQMEQAKQSQQPVQQPGQQPKSDLKTGFDVNVKNTGVSKEVNGLMAQEQLVTMQMHVTNPPTLPPMDATNSVTYVVTTDAWIAPYPPEVKEIQDFDKRFGEKLMAGEDFSGMESADDEFKSGDEPNVQRPARVAGRHGRTDGQGNGQTAGHTGHGGDKHGRKRDRAGSCPGFRAGSPGCCFELVQWTRLERSAPANREWRYRNLRPGELLYWQGFHKKKATPPPSQPAPADSSAAGTQGTSSTTLMEMTMQKSNFSQTPCLRSR